MIVYKRSSISSCVHRERIYDATNLLLLYLVLANTLRTLAKLKNGLVALERRNPGVDTHSKQLIREKIEKLRQLRSSCNRTTEAVSDLHIEFIDESEILEMAVPHNAPVLVTGFNFPILDESTVELLEQSVNENERIREEYVRAGVKM